MPWYKISSAGFYAVTGHSRAEIICASADRSKTNGPDRLETRAGWAYDERVFQLH